MNEIRIVELPAMEIISFYGFGEAPEDIVIDEMLKWAANNHYFQNPAVRCFGFNNPDPHPGSKSYGYEVWLTAPEGAALADKKARSFQGGAYAVVNCCGTLQDAARFIPESWKGLVQWLETSPYKMGNHQWLEEQLFSIQAPLAENYKKGFLNLDLYLPIQK